MTTESAYTGDDPRRILSSAHELAQRVRRAQRATWFPLLVFAALTFAAIPVRRYSGHHLNCLAVPGGRVCRVYSDADFVYWPIALVLAYVVIAAFYIRRSRAAGVGTRVRPYAIAGIIVAVVLTGVALWEFHSPPLAQGPTGLNGLLDRLATAGAAIGLALLVLAWAERSRALLLLTLAYLAVVLVPITLGGIQYNPPWYSFPLVSQGSVLLLGGIGFALVQRPGREERAVTSHPANGLDDVVHQRVRLGILTIANEARRVEFTYLRDNLGLSAGNLSQHLGVLEKAGLVTLEKGYEGKRPRTWVTLTKAGRTALTAEVTQLKLLISQIERTKATTD